MVIVDEIQFPNQWPVVTLDGLIFGIVIFAVVSIIAYVITKSRWSWVPGIMFGVLAAIAWSAAHPATATAALALQIIGWACA
jgi:hypothetical protein